MQKRVRAHVGRQFRGGHGLINRFPVTENDSILSPHLERHNSELNTESHVTTKKDGKVVDNEPKVTTNGSDFDDKLILKAWKCKACELHHYRAYPAPTPYVCDRCGGSLLE